ncbi:hypothetical protein SH1V18_03260 [Vallitalea longa]|uniref:Uncharacterized protein n=1 Tax=Vallitalea longa TaxID=2936439 RepID=A0A9W5Y8B1_9FIRM|nr:hypothetical protein [Vallitalea longa]GKX27846.1 hypothetical protein SH1V18_03260 [Vallitalea longa]
MAIVTKTFYPTYSNYGFKDNNVTHGNENIIKLKSDMLNGIYGVIGFDLSSLPIKEAIVKVTFKAYSNPYEDGNGGNIRVQYVYGSPWSTYSKNSILNFSNWNVRSIKEFGYLFCPQDGGWVETAIKYNNDINNINKDIVGVFMSKVDGDEQESSIRSNNYTGYRPKLIVEYENSIKGHIKTKKNKINLYSNNISPLRIKTNKGILSIPLKSNGNTGIRIKTNNGIKAINEYYREYTNDIYINDDPQEDGEANTSFYYSGDRYNNAVVYKSPIDNCYGISACISVFKDDYNYRTYKLLMYDGNRWTQLDDMYIDKLEKNRTITVIFDTPKTIHKAALITTSNHKYDYTASVELNIKTTRKCNI